MARARGWLTSPVVGAGTDESPIRPQLHGREQVDGDRLEFVIGNRDRCLVAYDVADPANLPDHGGLILADYGEMDETVSRLPSAKRQRLATLATEMGVGGQGRMRDVLRRAGRILDPNFREDRHLGRGIAPVPGSFGVDSFTDTTDLALVSHVGETGATWTEHPSFTSGAMVISSANRARAASVNNSVYYASGVPASNEYDVSGVLRCVSRISHMGVVGRMSTSADSMYTGRHNSGATGTVNEWQILKTDAGVGTILAIYAQTIVAGTDYAVVEEIRSATKKLYVDGVERISSTDDAVTGTGRAGIRGATGTNTTNLHLDSFDASDAASVYNLGTEDSAPADDAPTRSILVSRSLADAVAASDAADRTSVLARAAEDAVAGSDSLDRMVAQVRLLDDSAPATDAVVHAGGQVRTADDVAPASDVVTRLAGMGRAGDDSAPATDSVVGGRAYTRVLAGTAFAAEVAADTPRAHWRLNEPSGTTAEDASANNLDMTYNNTPTLDQAGGLVGEAANRAVRFTAAQSEFASRQNEALFGVDDRLALEIVFARNRTGVTEVLAAHGGGWTLKFNTANKLELLDGNHDVIAVSTATIADTGVFHHVVVTKSESNRRIFIDNVESAVTGTNDTLVDGSSNIFLGKSGLGDPFDGWIDEFALYGNIMSPTRIADHYAAVMATNGDRAPATDATTFGMSNARSPSDTAPATDAAGRLFVAARGAADSAPATDAVVGVRGPYRFTADSAPATDVTSRLAITSRASTDTAGGTDAASGARRTDLAAFDAAPASDSTSSNRGYIRLTFDTAAAFDYADAGPEGRRLLRVAAGERNVDEMRIFERIDSTVDGSFAYSPRGWVFDFDEEVRDERIATRDVNVAEGLVLTGEFEEVF